MLLKEPQTLVWFPVSAAADLTPETETSGLSEVVFLQTKRAAAAFNSFN